MRAMPSTRTYRFTITVTVGADDEGYEDPEWIADAASGTLANEYGYDCVYGDIEELVGADLLSLRSPRTAPRRPLPSSR